MKEACFCSGVIFMEVSPFKSCANGGGIYCLLLTRIFAKMLKNRIKMGQFRWHLNCPRFLAFVYEIDATKFHLFYTCELFSSKHCCGKAVY